MTQSDEVQHGTNNAYTNYGCRCDECRFSQRVYQYHRRKRVRDAGYAHGLASSYHDGCRCEPCYAAYKAQAEARRVKRHGSLSDRLADRMALMEGGKS